MKKSIATKLIAAFALLLFVNSPISFSQTATKTYKYESVPNDPLNARIYHLDNGLTVYMTVYKDAPRIQTYIATRAGSKNDPKDATGLAHYLEHMLFKGTDKYGSKDYAKEKVELDKIEALYEGYRKTTDDAKRKTIYHQIDSISGVAAKYAIANEYDKMLNGLVERRMCQAIITNGSLWYTAWVNAGKPMMASREISPTLANELKSFKLNHLIQDELLLSKKEKPEN